MGAQKRSSEDPGSDESAAKKTKYKFESFQQQVRKLKVPHFGTGLFGGVVSVDDGDDNHSEFGACLSKWRDLNLSETFTQLAKRSHALCKSLGQLVYNKDKVVQLGTVATVSVL